MNELAQREDGKRPARQQLELPHDGTAATITTRSINGSISAPSRLYWPVTRAAIPSR